MPGSDISRRSVLKGVGAGVAVTATAGTGTGQEGVDLVQYNVGLRSGASTSFVREAAQEIERTIYLEDHGTVISGRFPAAAADRLRSFPVVEFVEEDFTARAFDERLPWGIDRVDADELHANGLTGSGATIAVLDTGVDDDHPDLADNVVDGKAFTDACGESEGDCGFFGGDGYNGNDCNYAWSDDNDHGSHVAGTAAAVRGNGEGVAGGVSTEADVLAGKVLTGCGSGSYSAIADGIRWATDSGADVINMSLGGDSGSQTLKNACQYAVDNGVVVVAAAGNSGPCSDCVGYPAKYDSVIAVSAIDDDDNLASFSSTGPEIDLAAPGDGVLSTIPPESDDGSTYENGYETFPGTSMASPHVAGAAGQVIAETGISDTQRVRQELKDTAEDIGLADNDQGAGLLNAERAAGDFPRVSTGDASNVGSGTATLSGSVDSLGGAGSAEVYFEYGDGSLDQTTARTTLSATGSFTLDVSGLDPVTQYDYRAVVEAGDGERATGGTRSFTTDTAGGDDPPAIDALQVSDESFFFFERYGVEWTVSDANGDLAEVTAELRDASGDVVDSRTDDVSGADAAASYRLSPGFFEDGDSVELVVTDGSGNSVSETRSV